jgi:hypothetical protein
LTVRVNIVYDKRGNILAATVASEEADQFVLQEGEQAGEFDLPGELSEGGLLEFLENARVETESKKLTRR